MPNDFHMINNERIQLTDEEQTAVDSERLHQINVVKPVQKFKDLRRDRNQLLIDTHNAVEYHGQSKEEIAEEHLRNRELVAYVDFLN